MSPADILQAQRKRPFEPFRIEVSDGTAYEVRHPEMVMVTVGSVLIGIPPVGAALLPSERYETVSIRHIVKLIPLTQSVGGNGNGES
jgi:hypothetical protein